MARCGTHPSALRRGWQRLFRANVGLYASRRHLPLPLGTAGLWGELSVRPAEPSGGELSVPPLPGAEPGGGPEPSPTQLGEGSLLRPLSSGA